MGNTKKMESFGSSRKSGHENEGQEPIQQVTVSMNEGSRSKGCLVKILGIILICMLIVTLPSIACSSCFRCSGCGSCGGKKTSCISCGGNKSGCGKSKGCGKTKGCSGCSK